MPLFSQMLHVPSLPPFLVEFVLFVAIIEGRFAEVFRALKLEFSSKLDIFQTYHSDILQEFSSKLDPKRNSQVNLIQNRIFKYT